MRTARWGTTALAALAVLLACTAFAPLFDGRGWLLPVVVCVLGSSLGGALGRSARVPVPLLPLANVLVLGMALDLTVLPGSVLGLLPGPQTGAGLVRLLGEARDQVGDTVAPAPTLHGLVLLAAGGAGLVTVLVDTVAVTARRPVAAGLPLLALGVVPAVLAPGGVPWWSFALAACGYLLLLAAQGRDRLADDAGAGEATPGSVPLVGGDTVPASLPAVGRRSAVVALALALVLPAVLPSIGSLGLPGPGSSGGGRGTVQVVNPILDLGADLRRPADVDVLRYATSDGQRTYLRTVGLDDFDGQTWKPSGLSVPSDQQAGKGVPQQQGLAPGVDVQTVRTEITSSTLRQNWLSVPSFARQVDARGSWLYDVPTANIFSADNEGSPEEYAVVSDRAVPTADQLRAANGTTGGMDRFLEVPGDLPPSVEQAAQQVTGEAGATNAYDQALALQTWFRSSAFTYDETAPDGNGGSALEAFLADRRGYCVHFASAMAVMARTLGIPARVAVGFTGGTTDGNGFVVSAHDAHSWPELYFEGAGWVAFEPTPSVRTGAPPQYARPEVEPEAAPSTQAAPTLTAAPSVPATQPERQPLSSPATATSTGSSKVLERVGVGVLVLLLVLAGPVVTALARRRRRRRGSTPAERALVAWEELRRAVVDLGEPWPPGLSPRGTAQRLTAHGRLGPDGGAAVGRLTAAVEHALYAPVLSGGAGGVGVLERPAVAEDATDLLADVETVRAALAARARRRARVRAALVPADALHAVRRSVGGALDAVVGAGERARTGTRRSVGRLRRRARG